MTTSRYSAAGPTQPSPPKWPLAKGQSLVEGMIALTCLGLLWLSIPMLGRLFDIREQLLHASRLSAFHVAQGQTEIDAAAANEAWREFWALEHQHRWRKPDGSPVLPSGAANAKVERPNLADAAQPGGLHRSARDLRQQWSLHDSGLIRMRLSATVSLPGFILATGEPSLQLRAQTAVAKNAGASRSDAHSSARLEHSEAGWRRASQAVGSAGRQISQRAAPIDQAWGRALPDWDWLSPWQALRPESPATPSDRQDPP